MLAHPQPAGAFASVPLVWVGLPSLQRLRVPARWGFGWLPNRQKPLQTFVLLWAWMRVAPGMGIGIG